MDDELIFYQQKPIDLSRRYQLVENKRMNKNFRYFGTIALISLFIFLQTTSTYAQDTGKPATRSVAYYTIGGGVLGAGIGIAYWMLDPLAPSADLRGSVAQGYGVGVFLGFIFSVMQLNKQAVFPYTEPQIPSEFEGGAQNLPLQGNSYHFAENPTKPTNPAIPLLNYQYKF
ncbi:MAG: hypothetical protein MJE63_22130 [Proteobacteria bacterium]|nr:hypothetical protein [Pseudomonadota bacterium]